jgi:hypothetical protein
MDIKGRVTDTLGRAGKKHDIRFELTISDDEYVQLFRWRGRDLVITVEPEAVQGTLDLDGAVEPNGTFHDLATFFIDGVAYPIHDQEGPYRLTGQELRELSIPTADVLWQDDVDGARRIELHELVELKPGARFVTHVAVESRDSVPW